MSWPNKVYSRSLVPIYTKYNDTNMLFRYSGVQRGGKYLDSSGNTNNSVSVQGVNNADSKSINFCCDYATVTSPITGAILSSTANNHSFGAFIRPTIGASTQNSCFGKGITAAWSQYPNGGVLSYPGGALGISWYNGAAYVQIVASGTSFLQRYHTLYVFDNINHIAYFYINSVLVGSVNPLVIGPADEVAQPYRIGYSGTASVGMLSTKGTVKDCTLWSRALIAADIRKEWLQYARMVQLKTGWGSKVSIANESTAGNFVGNGSTPFEILSGTWKVSTQTVDGELHKVIECVAAGTVWLDRKFMGINSTEAAYGSWRGLFYHAPSATPTTVALTATAKNTPSVTTGYYFRGYNQEARFGRYSAGAFTDIRTLPAPGAALSLVDFQTGRKFNNEWQQSARLAPGAYGLTWTDWQTSSPADVSATYLTSEGVSFTANAGDWLSLGTVRDNFAFTKFLGEFIPTEV